MKENIQLYIRSGENKHLFSIFILTAPMISGDMPTSFQSLPRMSFLFSSYSFSVIIPFCFSSSNCLSLSCVLIVSGIGPTILTGIALGFMTSLAVLTTAKGLVYILPCDRPPGHQLYAGGLIVDPAPLPSGGEIDIPETEYAFIPWLDDGDVLHLVDAEVCISQCEKTIAGDDPPIRHYEEHSVQIDHVEEQGQQ